MNEADINVAIAMALGFTAPQGFWIFEGRRTAIPNYCNDLNTMHEAEKALPESMQGTMIDYLVIVQEQDGWDAFHSTAAQRAEAFLRTLNLWIEEPAT